MILGIGLIIQTTQCSHLSFDNVHHRVRLHFSSR